MGKKVLNQRHKEQKEDPSPLPFYQMRKVSLRANVCSRSHRCKIGALTAWVSLLRCLVTPTERQYLYYVFMVDAHPGVHNVLCDLVCLLCQAGELGPGPHVPVHLSLHVGGR